MCTAAKVFSSPATANWPTSKKMSRRAEGQLAYPVHFDALKKVKI
jgi:hypothetical protein